MIPLFVRRIVEVVRIESSSHALLAIRFKDFILDIKTILRLEMVEYHAGKQASSTRSNDPHIKRTLLGDIDFERTLLRDLVVE